jgi:hypothetical protein
MKRKPVPVEEYRAMVAAQSKETKYRAVRTQYDGMWFDSQGEAQRWAELRLSERCGLIADLDRQVPFTLDLGAGKTRVLRMDFTYREGGKVVAEDFKGHMPPMARLKLQAFAAQYPDYELRISRADGSVEVWE